MHLSDLHLGKSVLEHSMIEDQEYILKEIVDIVENRGVDMVLIAGDVYDKGIPNVEAVNLFSSFLTRLYKLGVKVLVISGNHDSKDRLSFGNELFVDNGVYIEGVFSGKLRKEVFGDEYGNLNIYMLPFVKPIDVRKFYSDRELDSYQSAVGCIIDNTVINVEERNIIMVHQFVTANNVEIERCDSENISLGGIDNIDVSLFDNFDYVALGHIHGPQRIIKDTVRYAGSPLKYSFSEVFHNKSVCIIDMKEKGNFEIELVSLHPIRDMRVIKGPLSKLIDKNIFSKENAEDYINVILTDDDYVVDAIGKLRRVYPNILKLEYQNKRTSFVSSCLSDEFEIKGKSPLELYSDFYFMQNNVELDDDRKRVVNSVIKEVSNEANSN